MRENHRQPDRPVLGLAERTPTSSFPQTPAPSFPQTFTPVIPAKAGIHQGKESKAIPAEAWTP